MEDLAKLDPYKIQQIQFYCKKQAKYTTLKSIIISLLIFSLSIIVSFNSLQNIWIKRSQLRIQSSDIKTSNIQLKENYLCAISKYNSFSVDNITLENYNFKKNFSRPNFVVTNKFDNNQDILKKSNGRKFVCYDIAGTILNSEYKLVLKTTSDIDVMFKTYSFNQILKQQKSNYQYVDTLIVPGSVRAASIYVKKIKGSVYDKLLIKYQPQSYLGLSNQLKILWTTYSKSITLYNTYQFMSQNLKQNELTSQIIVTRQNIGQILGKFFSWFTIFSLIFSYMIAPYVQFSFKVSICKIIYQNTYISNLQVSVFSYIKYLLASFISNIFKQEKLYEIFQKLQQAINIVNILKKQVIMKKLFHQNNLINSKKQDEQFKKSETQQFYQPLDIQNENQQNLNNQLIQQKQNQQIIFFNQNNELMNQSLIIKSIQRLDIGETPISLISNKGQGYKSSWNTIITFTISILVLIFLIFAGVFQFQQNQVLKTLIAGTPSQNTKYITLNPQDIIFRGNKTATDKFILQVKIVNQNYEIIENINLKNGSDCDIYVSGLNEIAGSGWNCLPSSITIQNNGKGQKRTLLVRFYFPTGLPFTNSKIEVTSNQKILQNSQFKDNIVQIKQTFSSSTLKAYQVQSIISKDQDEDNYYFTIYQSNNFDDYTLKGLSFQMMGTTQKFQIEQNTIWNIIDTSWGIFILAFSILLSKLSRSLNVRERQKITKSQENTKRNDISSIISIQYTLKQNFFKQQLSSIGFFYKQYLEVHYGKEK